MSLLYLILAILPIVSGVLIKILFVPATEGITVTGAHIFFTLDLPLGGLPITESQVNSWLVIISLFFFCLFLTNNLKTKNISTRQVIAEFIVESVEKLVRSNMGEFFMGFGPFITAILGISAMSSLMTLFGLFPATSDINVVAGWAILVFFLITYYKLKAGPLVYLKGFTEPIAFFAPINVASEFATPFSMSFRHYGNVLSGTIISILIATGLGGLSNFVLQWLPEPFASFELFRIGIPAIFSIYFDIFSGCLQAFIFAMLTMLYVSGGFPADEYFKRKAKKLAKQSK